MDKNRLEELKNMSKEEREAFLKAHKNDLNALSADDLDIVNGGFFIWSDPDSDWYYSEKYVYHSQK